MTGPADGVTGRAGPEGRGGYPHLDPRRVRTEALRWGLLAVAVLVMVIFIVAQRQSIEVSYGQSPSERGGTTEGSAGELSGATLPSVEEMAARVAAEPVVRLPGAVARWDEGRVREIIGTNEVRILVAPPGLDEEQRKQLREVDDATIRIVGTQVSGGLYESTPDRIAGWRAQFATYDVTDQMVGLIAVLTKQERPAEVPPLPAREPTEEELAPVLADLRAGRPHLAPGSTLTEIPERSAGNAFPDGARYVVLPAQPFGEPLPGYGPALAEVFPDEPIVVMYGNWIEYHGPGGEEFSEIAAASYYAQFGSRLSRYDYPQRNVLNTYLNQVTDIRYSGLFDRPLPYRPIDPLRVALPALPWVFAACVAAFLMLSIRGLRRSGGGLLARPGDPQRGGAPARLAGLTALAVEVSLLTDARSNPALTRGLVHLRAAREALTEKLPDRHVTGLLDQATAEFEETARTLDIPSYRPDNYLRGRLS